MSIETPLTRRQALMLSGSAAAGLFVAGLPRWAQAAPSAGQALPIPQLIEARGSEPVVLTLQKSQHRFGSAPAASRGISASYPNLRRIEARF
jgi:suppressor of ftsI